MNLHKFRYIFIRFVRLLVPVIAMIAASIAMVTFTKQITFTSKQEKAVADRMYEYFYSGLINGRFDEVFYKTAFSHYDRKSDGALTKYGYVETLEDFVVFIVEKGKSSDDKVKIDYYDQATALLKKAKETEPFASLPSEEKRLMNNVQLFIQNNDVSNALNSLNELKQVILSRHKEYQKIQRQNSWSIPLAFIGIALTLAFGAWGTILALKKEKGIIFDEKKPKY